ncbi:uncharacterized protein EI90DRAFT_3049680 [Cantharellus anzutake]|uniref:uncharacterized protein n=1 Tax=Cantharellus anzutake TaxID=1750568 RepID=UPI001906DEB2|nr:uncharacterized protein EI90DRAFT_3049680 [Cantharellus anzutake]KAF8334649.1 hypothetical protein EI90DRAFT_3049680 [Cantharellus anzutake]
MEGLVELGVGPFIPSVTSDIGVSFCRRLVMLQGWVQPNNLSDAILSAIKSHGLPFLEAQAILNPGVVIGTGNRFMRPSMSLPSLHFNRGPPHHGPPSIRQGSRGRVNHSKPRPRPYHDTWNEVASSAVYSTPMSYLATAVAISWIATEFTIAVGHLGNLLIITDGGHERRADPRK